MRPGGINQLATRARMRNAEVDTQTESHSHPDSLIVQSKTASRDRKGMEPVAAVRCRDCG